MRILYITQTFPPEPGPTRRPLGQAIQLQRLGHEVTVLTTFPSAPLGRVFPGYRCRLWMRERHEGVEVIRTWCLAVPNRGLVLRTLGWLSFAVSATLSGLFLGRRDLVMASVPNLGTELAGWLVARGKRALFLLEMRDLLPDSLALVGIDDSALFYRLLDRYLSWMYRAADFIAVPGRSMVRAFEDRGLPGDRLLLLPHAIDDAPRDERDSDAQARAGSPSDPLAEAGPTALRVLFAGSFNLPYDMPTVVAAGRLLEAEGADVKIYLLGTGRERASVEAGLADRPSTVVTLLDPVPPESVGVHLRSADVLLAPSVYPRHMPYLVANISTKSAEYFGAGKAIVAIENHTTLQPVLAESGAGVTVPGGEPQALAAAIRKFADDRDWVARCGDRARAYAREHLRREQVVARFDAELSRRLAASD